MTNQTITPGTGSLSLSQILDNLKLDPARPFYKFVTTYLAASAGLTPVYQASAFPDFLKGGYGVFPGALVGAIRLDLHKTIQEVRGGLLPQGDAEQSLLCMLANSAYESIDKAEWQRFPGDPAVELFYHVRNAAAHGNAWDFRNGQPKYRVEWNGLVIEKYHKGLVPPLQGKTCFYGSLQPADLLRLLEDVEALII